MKLLELLIGRAAQRLDTLDRRRTDPAHETDEFYAAYRDSDRAERRDYRADGYSPPPGGWRKAGR